MSSLHWHIIQTLPVKVRDNSQYADQDKIDTDEIIEYFGENHHNNAENKARDTHP
jgi:hypothetical protein